MLNEGQFGPSLSIEDDKKNKQRETTKLFVVAKKLKFASGSFSSFHKGFLVIMWQDRGQFGSFDK
jgi:hypothetical protein